MHIAYDRLSEWFGTARADKASAQRDADAHNEGCAEQGSASAAGAYAVDADGYLVTDDGTLVWPPHGRSTGAVRVPRHVTPGRGGSRPAGSRPKRAVSVTVDAEVLEATRERVGRRGLSAEVERLLRAALG